jgi:uncharacterized membrane protein YhaH (DUF805 family)
MLRKPLVIGDKPTGLIEPNRRARMQWIVGPLKRYADFNGRASRMEFWVFLIFGTLLTLAARYFDELDGIRVPIAMGMGTAEAVATLVVLLPTVAVGVRRLHDTGRSGWWTMLIYLPWLATLATVDRPALLLVTAGALIVGGVAWIILMVLPGDPVVNAFGEPSTH